MGPSTRPSPACGSNLGIFEPEPILELNFYCDTYGIDSISFGTLTAFVMECYEAGVLDLEKTGGLDLRFGNSAGRDRAAAPDGARRGLRADRGHGRARDEGLLRRALRRRPGLRRRRSAWKTRAWSTPST